MASAVAALAVIAAWALLIIVYPKLPPTVPTHFGFDGHANQFGSKVTLIVPAIVVTLVCGVLLASNRFSLGRPNFPVTISTEMLPRAMSMLRAFIATQAAIVALVFFTIECAAIAGASGLTVNLTSLLVATAVVELIAIAAYFAATYSIRA
jgi:uncharacterized membrane protein